MWRRTPIGKRIKFTRFGWFYFFFATGVGAAAINTGNNLLYLMLGLLLGFIIISGILSDSCLWGLTATLQPIGDLYAGQPADFEITARKSWFPGVILQIETYWQNAPHAQSLFFWISRYGSATETLTVTPLKRGRLVLTQLRYATRFPFGLLEKRRAMKREDEWVVFPAIRLLPARFLHSLGFQFADQPSGVKGQGATPFDLRPYQLGDSSKRIHWKSSAKRGALMVTEMEEESAASPIIGITRWPEDLEPFIEHVASLVYSLYRAGTAVGLRTPDAFFPADSSRSHLKKILTYLALVDPASP